MKLCCHTCSACSHIGTAPVYSVREAQHDTYVLFMSNRVAKTRAPQYNSTTHCSNKPVVDSLPLSQFKQQLYNCNLVKIELLDRTAVVDYIRFYRVI